MPDETSEAHLAAVINGQRKSFPLGPGITCSIGRGHQNTVVLDDNQVSRSHAMVHCTDAGSQYLTDLGSRNGTLVNQRRVTAPVLLQQGDRIKIGSQEFEFHGESAPQSGQTGFGETMLGVVYSKVTVLVTDIRGFTGLSRRLGEARLSEAISTWFRESGAVLSGEGARAQKYIGDAIMAFWIHDNDPPHPGELLPVFHSLQGVLEIVSGLRERFSLDEPVRIGAGINTGFACIGNIGSTTAADYTAISDAVNLTFRLESATKELGCDVALGPETYNLLAGRVDAAGMFEEHYTRLKGYEEPLQVFGGTCAAIDEVVNALRSDFAAQPDQRSTTTLGPETNS